MAIKNLFGRGIGFGGPEWIPTHGYSIGVNTTTYIIASGISRLSPRFEMRNVQPAFEMRNRQPAFPFDRVEVEE